MYCPHSCFYFALMRSSARTPFALIFHKYSHAKKLGRTSMSSGGERFTSLLGLLNCNSNSKTTAPLSNSSAHRPQHASPAKAPTSATTSTTGIDLSKLLAAVAVSTPQPKRQPNKKLASSTNSATASGECCHLFFPTIY